MNLSTNCRARNVALTIKVKIYLRHPTPGWFSIERVVNTFMRELPEDIEGHLVRLRFPSRGIWNRLKTLANYQSHESCVHHISGDIHYIALVLPRRYLVLTIHDLVCLESSAGIKRLILEWFWFRIPVKRAHVVTVVSEQTRKALIKLIPEAEHKVVVIPNPISSKFSPVKKNNSTAILHVGTTVNKNLERAATVAKRLSLPFLVLGKLTDSQHQLLTQLSLEYAVFTGLDDSEVPEVYAQAGVLLFASLSEGFGMPIIEAQASGIPVITSNREPMRSVAGSGALLVDPESVDEMCDAVSRVLASEVLRKELILEGFLNVKRFAASAAANSYAMLYRNVASEEPKLDTIR